MRDLTKSELKLVRGSLRVRAIVDTRMGSSDRLVPAGTEGFVLGSRDGLRAVFWPDLVREYKGDWRSGSHPAADLEPVGRA